MFTGSRGNAQASSMSFSISRILGKTSARDAAREAIFKVQALPRQTYAYNLNRRYNDVTYLTAHNAYEYYAITHERFAADSPEFVPQAQPEPIAEQLTQGVRALMLDIERYKDDIYLCHRYCDQKAILLQPVLDTIGQFLENSSDAVITIIFESRVDTDEARKLLDKTIEAAGLKDRIFDPRESYVADVDSPGDWPTQREASSVNRRVAEDGWPSLLWMKLHNKDLVIFTERTDGKDGFPNVWDYVVENHWGILSLIRLTWCRHRYESQTLNDVDRSLLTLNHFPGARLTGLFGGALLYRLHQWVNNQRFIERHVNAYQLRSRGRLPNFVAVDFFSIGGTSGSPIDAVQAINQNREHGTD